MKKSLLFLLFFVFTSINYSQNIISSTTNYGLTATEQSRFLNAATFTETETFTSEILKKRLKELDNKTPFNVVYNATVERFIRLYLKTRKDDISNLMDKAQYYFPIFEEYLDKYDLPLEIKYLAVVESALNAEAKSVAGAKGIWQFMYHTGKQYNLEVTSYVDDRSDVLKATRAACEYLQDLYKIFNDWDLALAAYNSGPGNVSKAIKKSGGLRNYWNIRTFLPKETSSYVPAFYTTLYLFEYGKEHKIHPKNTQINFHQTDTIIIKKQITFNEIKQRTGINNELLHFLNPQYKLAIIPASNKANYTLTLPKYLVDKFEANASNFKFKAISTIEKPNYIIPTRSNSYVVKSGDNLPRIAKKFNISTQQLKKWNGLDTNFLIKEQRLVVTTKKLSFSPLKTVPDKSKKAKTYVVKEGDSLWKISRQFANVTINQLRNWNEIWGVSHVKPGTILKILTD